MRVAIRRTALGLLGAGGILAIGVWPGTPDPRAGAVLSAPPRVVDDIKVSESDRVDALRRARHHLDVLVSRTYSLDEIKDGLAAVSAGEVISAVVQFQEES